MLRVGVPKEIKAEEYRVGLTPSAIARLVEGGSEVLVEVGAGLGAGFTDLEYLETGATLVADAQSVWQADLVVKVKEPQPSEYPYLRPDLILFTYLHLAASRDLTMALLKSHACCVGYETVQLSTGQLPLLAPMSKIAGRLATQYGAHFLTKHQGGRGVLLGGIGGVAPGQVLILGGGVVGTESAKVAIGMGAEVTILDVNLDRLAELETILGGKAKLLYSQPATIAETIQQADLVVGAVLVAGARTPVLVPAELIPTMRLGAVIIDVAVDQGGCIATMRLTSHSQPTYTVDGVLHCGIPNLPGAVARTATQALVNATFPYVQAFAKYGKSALDLNPALAKGVNIDGGKLVHPEVIKAFPDLA